MKAVIFDMDGVIIDSEPMHFSVDKLILNKVGITISQQDLEEYVGMTNPEMWAKIIDKYRLTRTVNELIDYQLTTKLRILKDTYIEPIDGIPVLIQLLTQHRIPFGVASSSPRQFIEGVLTKFDIIGLFSCVVSGEEVENGKPAPDVYEEAARLLKVNSGDCVVIEDSRNGVIASKRAGMKCIGYRNSNSGKQDLSGADYVVDSITEITWHLLNAL